MAEPYFTVNTKEVGRSIDRLLAAVSSSGLALFLTEEVGPYLEKRAVNRFKSEGDDAVGKWQPLAEATQAIRAAGDWPVAPGHPINRRTGELEEWVTQSGWNTTFMSGGAALEFPPAKPSGELADKVETAQRGRDRTPPRPVLAVNEVDLNFVMTSLAMRLQEAWV